ncbi:MAG: LacI family DNA-binding transcriptional regulator [Treponemataceae bacterium]|nr:MAG: LacI family DNA-binding transcriptional regulator [Treponemataceae bacterium]
MKITDFTLFNQCNIRYTGCQALFVTLQIAFVTCIVFFSALFYNASMSDRQIARQHTQQHTTMDEIATILGVSKITVSRALKGQPGVSSTLRKDVQALAGKMGYEYKRLRNTDKKKNFVFLTPKRFYLANDQFYHEIYYHLTKNCTQNRIEKNWEISIQIIERDAENSGLLPHGISDADGIFVGGEMSKAILASLAALNIPYVVIDYNIIGENAFCVVLDNCLIGAIAAEYLVAKGYTQIGFIGAHNESSNIYDRFHGFLKIIKQNNLIFRDEWHIKNHDAATDYYTLDLPLPEIMPQAFVCHNDRSAYFFMERLRAAGLRIPQDVALVSIDNTDLASQCRPPLTSVNIDRELFANTAFDLLCAQFSASPAPRRVYLDTKIIERESTAHPCAAGGL